VQVSDIAATRLAHVLRRSMVLTVCLRAAAELLLNALAGTGEGAAGPCPRPEELVCLGLGSVSDSTKSQDQFHLFETLQKALAKDVCALLSFLRSRVAPPRPLIAAANPSSLALQLKGKATVFDPVFAPEDIAFFHEHGFEPLTAEVSPLWSLPSLPRHPSSQRSKLTSLPPPRLGRAAPAHARPRHASVHAALPALPLQPPAAAQLDARAAAPAGPGRQPAGHVRRPVSASATLSARPMNATLFDELLT
jgi:hypothetical protein